MQQRFRKLALFVGAATLAAGGLVIVACSAENVVTTPTFDSGGGGGPKEGGGGGPEAGMNEAGPQPDGGGADADCSKNPVLKDNTTGYVCPYAGGADAGANCTNAETCCEPSKVGMTYPPSYCATGAKGDGNVTCKAAAPTFNSSFDAGSAWECADKNACATGQVCCMIADPGQVAMGKTLGIGNTLAADKKHPPACGVQRAFNEGGSRCRTGATCPTGEKKLCSLSDDNCVAPTKCTPFVDFQQTNLGTCL